MILFQLDEVTNEVKINVPWIKMVPELAALFDGRAKKDSYDKDTMGRKRLTYIYFMLDFNSPLADWEEDKRHAESLVYSGLSNGDVTDVVRRAMEMYEKLQFEACRPLKTYRQSLRGLDAMDAYLGSVDFNLTDKQGKLLYTPNQFTGNLALVNKAYDELRKLRKRIEEEMSNSTSIRGSATLGDKEARLFNKLSATAEKEPEAAEMPDEGNSNWLEIGDFLRNSTNGKDDGMA